MADVYCSWHRMSKCLNTGMEARWAEIQSAPCSRTTQYCHISQSAAGPLCLETPPCSECSEIAITFPHIQLYKTKLLTLSFLSTIKQQLSLLIRLFYFDWLLPATRSEYIATTCVGYIQKYNSVVQKLVCVPDSLQIDINLASVRRSYASCPGLHYS